MTDSKYAAHRDTETKPPSPSALAKQIDTKQQRAAEKNKGGRPKGATNKPKGILDKTTAMALLANIKPLLPETQYNEIRDAIASGKTLSTLKEAKIMLALMGPPLWKRLIDEGSPSKAKDGLDEISGESSDKEFQRDTNERLKIYNSFLSTIVAAEKAVGNESDKKTEPIFEVVARNGGDSARLAILFDGFTSRMGGIRDDSGREEDISGTIPSELPERQVSSTDSEQVEATWILDSDSSGSSPRGDNEA